MSYAVSVTQHIASSIETEMTGAYNITGMERTDYIDMIRLLKQSTGAEARIVKVPYQVVLDAAEGQ